MLGVGETVTLLVETPVGLVEAVHVAELLPLRVGVLLPVGVSVLLPVDVAVLATLVADVVLWLGVCVGCCDALVVAVRVLLKLAAALLVGERVLGALVLAGVAEIDVVGATNINTCPWP